METQTQTLKDWLRENLTAKNYLALSSTLGITETKLSRLLNNTDKWDAPTFKKIATELKEEFSPIELLQNFGLKNEIMVNEMEEIVKEYENKEY